METNTRWLRIRDLFERATELPTREREAFVEASNDDSMVQNEVISLLHADQCQKKKPLTGAIEAALEAGIEARRQKLVGSIVGEYRLLSVIGHGGTGTVYLAERLDAAGNSKVAIKIVEGAAINGIARRRFKDERQILANLSHPNIARLFDAGDTAESYPYLVMDYIEGEPIDRYCDRHRLTVRQRIELFLKVCDAVEYAHRNLVIHRDLKPQNILVTKDGMPKLLDFGIAKLLSEGAGSVEPNVTRLQEQLLTPAYASPEQILGKQVSTASDIYTLGVVLYELLAGLSPRLNVVSGSYIEHHKQFSTHEPREMSKALHALSKTALNHSASLTHSQQIAAARGTELTRLVQSLRGDLDGIVAQSLNPFAENRYQSAEQLSDDLQSYLAYRPVEAVRNNGWYIAKRFIARNKFASIVSVSLFILSLTALAVILSQAHRLSIERDFARNEKQTSDNVAEFMVNVFSDDSIDKTKNAVSAKELLDSAARRIHTDLNQQQAMRARLLEAIGLSYQHQGYSDQSVTLLLEASQIYRRIYVPDTFALAIALKDLGEAQRNHGEITAARASLEEALVLLQKNHAEETSGYAEILVNLGYLESIGSNDNLARGYLERALPILRKAYGANGVEVARALMALSSILIWQSDFVSGEPIAREAVRIYRSAAPELHPDRLSAETLLAECWLAQHRVPEAALLIEETFSKNQALFDATSSTTVSYLQTMIELRLVQNRLTDAKKLIKRTIEIGQRRYGEHNFNTGFARTNLGLIQWKLGKMVAAEAELRKAISIYNETLKSDHPYLQSAKYFLSEVLLSRHKVKQSIAISTSLFQSLTKTEAPPWRIARTENVLGAALFAQHKFDEAQPLLEHSYEVLSTTLGPDLDTVQLAHDRLQRFYIARHDHEKLIALHAAELKRHAVNLSSAR